MAGRQTPVFFLTLIMDTLVRRNLTIFSASTVFFFTYKTIAHLRWPERTKQLLWKILVQEAN